MDTIFVKSVRPGSPASQAGLHTGDRLLAVNGETIAARPYSYVIQLIHRSAFYLKLLVVPKEEDLIQLHWGETAHNPETNQRLSRLRSPEMHRQSTPRHPSHASPRRSVDSAQRQGPMMAKETCLDYSLCDAAYLNQPGCRLSLDGSAHSLPPPDDSLIISRIRKSCEQKEEFLRRPAIEAMPQREFYPRLEAPIWPPAIPASAIPPAAPPSPLPHEQQLGFVCGGPVTNPPRVVDRVASPPPVRLVSQRARQFEIGLCQPDRTPLYRSELAGMVTKNSVTNVAVRRREFENKSDWRNQRESRSLDSNTSTSNTLVSQTSAPGYLPSGNRTTPVGGTKLHCDPPKDYVQPSPEREEGVRQRCNSLETVGEDGTPRRHKAVRQDSYLAAVKKIVGGENQRSQSADGDSGSHGSPNSDSVLRRQPKQVTDEDRATRRVSYMKATWGDRISADPDLDLSDSEPSYRSVHSVPPTDKEVVIEGSLTCKVTLVDGKKSHDRSWRTVWVVLRGNILYLFKDKKDSTSETPVEHERVEVGGAVTVSEEAGKRRHVLRLCSTSSELLLQAESGQDLARWLQALHHHNNNYQRGSVSSGSSGGKGGLMKLPNFRNRSPTGQSPSSKNRKPAQTESAPGSGGSKAKTWKVRVAKQLRRMGGSSPVSPTHYPEGATISIPLELCPMSNSNEFVPLLVELCTSIVEAKGLDIIGIYRVPGNTAAVSSLTEAVNRGLDSALLDQDQRWTDVNVISSLLKSFFRKLPDCLLTTELYPLFIDADKITDKTRRVATLRKLIQELPEHNYQTLKHLMYHLKAVVEHSGINKMEARNLAIVFGPTLIKAGDNNMATMVNDMSHQCRIVETLILYVEWCFSDDSIESLVVKEDSWSGSDHQESDISNQTLLLDNIHKVEGLKESPTKDVSAKDIVSSLISAANRKMQKARTRKTVVSIAEENLSQDDAKPQKEKATGRKERSGSGEEGSLGRSVASSVRQSALFSGSIVDPKLLSSTESTDKEVESGGKSEESDTAPVVPTNSVEGGTIKSYTGLHQVTQERVRRFEMETKAMLQRENLKKWEENKEAAAGSGLSAIGKSIDPTKEAVNTIGKRLKACRELSPIGISMMRKGSLDSLKDAGNSSWQEWQQSNASDDGSDLLVSLTSTFDAKMRHLSVCPDSSESEAPPTENDSPAPPQQTLTFRDPSLHRNCNSQTQFKAEEEEKKEEEEVKKEISVEKEEEKENCNTKLRRSESLNKRDEKRDANKLRRAESLNKKEGKILADKLKRSDSLTKNEKTESNLNKRRQLEAGKLYKMKRKTGGSSERSIKRRHTVGGTKDLDKVTWLDNRQAEEAEKGRRTSSPDLSRHVLVEVRPWSLVEPTCRSSSGFNQPLESHM